MDFLSSLNLHFSTIKQFTTAISIGSGKSPTQIGANGGNGGSLDKTGGSADDTTGIGGGGSNGNAGNKNAGQSDPAADTIAAGGSINSPSEPENGSAVDNQNEAIGVLASTASSAGAGKIHYNIEYMPTYTSIF